VMKSDPDPELDMVDMVDDLENLGSSKEEARDRPGPFDMVVEESVMSLQVLVSVSTWVSLEVKARALMGLV
jgi:hypothetical protein